ncbi:hypothetical protein V2J09_007123, partial [Rumex salicifolius]
PLLKPSDPARVFWLSASCEEVFEGENLIAFRLLPERENGTLKRVEFAPQELWSGISNLPSMRTGSIAAGNAFAATPRRLASSSTAKGFRNQLMDIGRDICCPFDFSTCLSLFHDANAE